MSLLVCTKKNDRLTAIKIARVKTAALAVGTCYLVAVKAAFAKYVMCWHDSNFHCIRVPKCLQASPAVTMLKHSHRTAYLVKKALIHARGSTFSDRANSSMNCMVMVWWDTWAIKSSFCKSYNKFYATAKQRLFRHSNFKTYLRIFFSKFIQN